MILVSYLSDSLEKDGEISCLHQQKLWLLQNFLATLTVGCPFNVYALVNGQVIRAKKIIDQLRMYCYKCYASKFSVQAFREGYTDK